MSLDYLVEPQVKTGNFFLQIKISRTPLRKVWHQLKDFPKNIPIPITYCVIPITYCARHRLSFYVSRKGGTLTKFTLWNFYLRNKTMRI